MEDVRQRKLSEAKLQDSTINPDSNCPNHNIIIKTPKSSENQSPPQKNKILLASGKIKKILG